MTHDPVENPEHYNRAGIEVIDVIETYTPNSPHLANVLKYVCRHSYKGKPLEDLRKARWYLNRAIERMERETVAEIAQLGQELQPEAYTTTDFLPGDYVESGLCGLRGTVIEDLGDGYLLVEADPSRAEVHFAIKHTRLVR